MMMIIIIIIMLFLLVPAAAERGAAPELGICDCIVFNHVSQYVYT